MATKKELKPLNQLFEENSGRIISLGGKRYRVRYQRYQARYPYPHIVEEMHLVPLNKNTKWYQDIRAQLGDDWFVDASHLEDNDFAAVYTQLANKGSRRKSATSSKTRKRRTPRR